VQKGNTLAGLSKYVKRSPKWYYFVLPLFIIFLIDYIILGNISNIFVILVIPFFIFIVIDIATIKITNSKFNLNRIMYMDFISIGMATLFFWAGVLLKPLIAMSYYSILALAIAFPAFLRFLVLYIYYPAKMGMAMLLSANYTFSYIISSVAFYDISSIAFKFIIPLIVATIVYIVFSYVFLTLSTIKFTKKYSSKPSELIDFFLDRDNDGEIGDKFFGHVYNRKRRVPVITTNIKSGDKDMVTLIFPFVHPGPFGNLCTSNLPVKLAEELKRDNIMVFHTATTNSNNCSGKNDIKSIADAVSKSLSKMKYTDKVSDFVKFNVDGYDVSLQKFGNSAFSAVIPYGKVFDDISLESGLKVMKALHNSGADNFALLDAQNSFTKDAEELSECDMLITPLIEHFKDTPADYPAVIGYAQNYKKINGLASMGIQALVLKINGSYNAIVLTDSNNISRDIIKLARSGVDKRVKNMDIYTTDNHVVNVGQLDINPLGMHCDPSEVVDLINKTVSQAIETASPATVGMNTDYVNVTMGEENAFHNLIQTVKGSIRVAKYSIGFVLLISMLISVISFRYLVLHL
jgi:putative membrane protein